MHGGSPSLRRGSCTCSSWPWSHSLESVRSRVRVNFGGTLLHLLQFLACIFVIAVAPGWAKEHPVPLDKNVDSAKCLECHEDKIEGQGSALRDRDGMLELSRSAGQQRHHPDQADHFDAAGAMPQLPRRQRRSHDQGHGASTCGARLHQVPRPAHQRQQESAAESGCRVTRARISA